MDVSHAMDLVVGCLRVIRIGLVGACMGMVGAGDGDELGLRQVCGAVVWAADDLGSRGHAGADPQLVQPRTGPNAEQQARIAETPIADIKMRPMTPAQLHSIKAVAATYQYVAHGGQGAFFFFYVKE